MAREGRNHPLNLAARWALGNIKFRFAPRSDNITSAETEATVGIKSISNDSPKYRVVNLVKEEKPNHDGGNIDWYDGNNNIVTWMGPASRYFPARLSILSLNLDEDGAIIPVGSDPNHPLCTYSEDITIHPEYINTLSNIIDVFYPYYYFNGKKFDTASRVIGAAIIVVEKAVFRLFVSVEYVANFNRFISGGLNVEASNEKNDAGNPITPLVLFREQLHVVDRSNNSRVLHTIEYGDGGMGKRFIPTPWFFSQDGSEGQAIRSFITRPIYRLDGVTSNIPENNTNTALRYQQNVPVKLKINTPSAHIEDWTVEETWILDSSWLTGSITLKETTTIERTQDTTIASTTSQTTYLGYPSSTYNSYLMGDIDVTNNSTKSIAGVTPLGVDYVDNVAVYIYVQEAIEQTILSNGVVDSSGSYLYGEQLLKYYDNTMNRSGTVYIKTTAGFQTLLSTLTESNEITYARAGGGEDLGTVTETTTYSFSETAKTILFADIRNGLFAFEQYAIQKTKTITLNGSYTYDFELNTSISGVESYSTSLSNHYFLLYNGQVNSESILLSPYSYSVSNKEIVASSHPIVDFIAQLDYMQRDALTYTDGSGQHTVDATYTPYSSLEDALSLSDTNEYSVNIPYEVSNMHGFDDPLHGYLVSSYVSNYVILFTGYGQTNYLSYGRAGIASFYSFEPDNNKIESPCCPVGSPFSANKNHVIMSFKLLNRSHLVNEDGYGIDTNANVTANNLVTINYCSWLGLGVFYEVEGNNDRFYPVRLTK